MLVVKISINFSFWCIICLCSWIRSYLPPKKYCWDAMAVHSDCWPLIPYLYYPCLIDTKEYSRVSQMFKLVNQCWPQVFLVKYTHRIRGNQKYLIFFDIFTCPKPFKVLVHTALYPVQWIQAIDLKRMFLKAGKLAHISDMACRIWK